MRYIHTNIVAKDWKRLSEFYINVFGCCAVKSPERKLSGDWLDRATGLSGARLEGVHLLLPGFEASGPTLEIFSYDRMEESGTMYNYRLRSRLAMHSLQTSDLPRARCIRQRQKKVSAR